MSNNRHRLWDFNKKEVYDDVWINKGSNWSFQKLKDQNGPKGKDKETKKVFSLNVILKVIVSYK